MKSIKLLLVAAALTLSACGKGASSAEVSTSSADNTSSSEVVSSVATSSAQESSSYVPSSSSSSTPTLDPRVANSPWGVEAAQASLNTLGVVVPYLEADAFEYKVTTDDFGDPAIWFFLYYETQEIAEAKIVDYAWAAYEQDYYECVVEPTWFTDPDTYSMWQQNVLYADKVVNEKHAVEIQGLDSIKEYNGKGMGCLGLFCFNYIPNVDNTKFPTYAVEDTLGGKNDVPGFEDVDGLTFSFQFFIEEYSKKKCLEIVIKSTVSSFEIEEYYFYALLSAGYTIFEFSDLDEEFVEGAEFVNGDEYPEFTDEFYYYAYPKNGHYCVCFDFDLYNNVFVIDIFVM